MRPVLREPGAAPALRDRRGSRSPTGRPRAACLRSLEEGGFRARPGTRDELLELRHEADLAAMVGAHHAHVILPSGTKAGSLVATPGLLEVRPG